MSEQLYNVEITPYGEEAIFDTAFSIVFQLKAPESAKRWANEIRKEINKLSSYPEKIQLTPEEPWRSLGLRRLVVGKYYIYFLIFEQEKMVRVIDVVYQGMNQAKRLTQLPFQDVLPS